jgi:pyridoxamine 5'-phosphate oxidase
MLPDLSVIRTEYARAGLHERDLDPSPLKQLQRWLRDALDAGHPEPTAMTLATVSPDGEPAARVVLLKGLDHAGLTFFTHYTSDKGRDLEAHPFASLNFFWLLLERQARIFGRVTKTSREESELYFKSRPRESQLGAWASRQSEALAGREELEARLAAERARFGEGEIPCPPAWGGYRVVVDRLELWQGRPNRLHDRLRYSRIDDTHWQIDRLAP